MPLPDRPTIADERGAQPYPMPGRALAPRFGGTSLFYLSARGMGDGLWRLQDGEALEIWKGADGAVSEPAAVSPDGRHVAVVLNQGGKRHLTIMSADGTDSRALASSIDTQGTADWSPDAAWIVTGGRDAQGPALFKIPVDGGMPVRLVSGQAINPVWSPNGNLIVYSGPNVGGLAPLLACDRTARVSSCRRSQSAEVAIASCQTDRGWWTLLAVRIRALRDGGWGPGRLLAARSRHGDPPSAHSPQQQKRRPGSNGVRHHAGRQKHRVRPGAGKLPYSDRHGDARNLTIFRL